MQSVTDTSFQDEIDYYAKLGTITVIVDYWAPWCAPCRRLEPILEYAEASDIVVLKVNIDENPKLAQGMTSVPRLDFYQKGKLLHTHTGVLTRRQLMQIVDSF